MGSGHVAGGCNLVDLKETRSVPEKVHHTLSSCSSSHRPFSVALLWILCSSVPCGFFPLSDSVLSVLFHDVVESFRFRAVWILSTRRFSVVRCVWRCCGFFPLQSRVGSFHSAAQCFSLCLALLWILSTAEPQSLLSFLLCCACAALQLSGTQPNAKP